MKQVKEVPPPEYGTLRDPWRLRVRLALLDWRPRYRTSRSAASAIHAAAIKRGVKATVNVRGETLYVQGGTPTKANGAKKPLGTRKPPARPAAKKATTAA